MNLFYNIKTAISEQFEIDTDDVSRESNFEEDLGADSLDKIDLVMTLEGHFDLDLTDVNVQHLKTVGDAVELIEERINGDKNGQ